MDITKNLPNAADEITTTELCPESKRPNIIVVVLKSFMNVLYFPQYKAHPNAFCLLKKNISAYKLLQLWPGTLLS